MPRTPKGKKARKAAPVKARIKKPSMARLQAIAPDTGPLPSKKPGHWRRQNGRRWRSKTLAKPQRRQRRPRPSAPSARS